MVKLSAPEVVLGQFHTTLYAVLQRIKQHGFVQTQHLMDSGYLSSELLVARQNSEIQLIGPVKRSSTWQRKTPDAFTHDDFQIDWKRKKVNCPENHQSASRVESVTLEGMPIITVNFPRRNCCVCPVHGRCIRADLSMQGCTIAYPSHHDFTNGPLFSRQAMLSRHLKSSSGYKPWETFSPTLDISAYLPYGRFILLTVR